MRSRRTLLLAIASIALAGCAGSSPGAVNTRCSSIMRFSGPALTLASANDSATGAAIATVVLSQITVDRAPVNLAQLLQDSQSTNLKSSADGLVCTLPCGLSSRQGTYSFQVSASGHLAATQTVVAKYENTSRGSSAENCAVTMSDGTVTNLSLQPESAP